MRLLELLDGSPFANGVMTTEIPEDWGQGRTAYGGLTASICASCAAKTFPDLPPLRSVQVAFVAPAAGAVTTKAEILRQGKSTTFVEASLSTEKGIATRGSLVYGAGRESSVALTDVPMPDLPGPEEGEWMDVTPLHPKFLNHFEISQMAGGKPFMSESEHYMQWWARSKDPADWGTAIGLLAIGDLTPPAAAPKMKTFAPVSSVNWQVDFLGNDFSTEDGWYLLQSDAQWAGDGWSAQDMVVWSSDGRPVIAGRQTIVMFG